MMDTFEKKLQKHSLKTDYKNSRVGLGDFQVKSGLTVWVNNGCRIEAISAKH